MPNLKVTLNCRWSYLKMYKQSLPYAVFRCFAHGFARQMARFGATWDKYKLLDAV